MDLASTTQRNSPHEVRTALGEARQGHKVAEFLKALRNPWRVVPGIIFVILYIALDRLTVFFSKVAGSERVVPAGRTGSSGAHRTGDCIRAAYVRGGTYRVAPELPSSAVRIINMGDDLDSGGRL